MQEIINGNIDVLAVTKTKIDVFLQSALFCLEGFYRPYRLDCSRKSGGILVYVRLSLPSRKLKCQNIPFGIQAIPSEINLKDTHREKVP